MRIVRDSELSEVPIETFVGPISKFVVADFEGHTTAPPRHSVDFPDGRLVFTTGGFKQLAGFRAYETFDSPNRESEDQVVAAWDTDKCRLAGVSIGNRLGAIRTGVLGGIAVDCAIKPHGRNKFSCAIIGTGLQAETQLLGIEAQVDLEDIRIYSRDAGNRDEFAQRLHGKASNLTICHSAEDAIDGADIVVLATSSPVPVVHPSLLNEAAHITTVGPKFKDAQELPIDTVGNRLLFSDSPQQIAGQGASHMLFEHPRSKEIQHLGQLITAGRRREQTKTLYLSAGLAGTEVVALDAAIRYLKTERN